MSITDELRKYADELDTIAAMKSEHGMSPVAVRLSSIADRIDEAHKAELFAKHNKSYTVGYETGYDVGFANADDWLADHEDGMAEHGWVKLPVDADGVTIRIGDVMDGVAKYDSLKSVTGEVVTICFNSMGDSKVETSVGLRVWAKDGKSYHTSYIDPDASVYRHHHEPTVEDLLMDLLADWAEQDEQDAGMTDLIAEYAAKLRLAGDAE